MNDQTKTILKLLVVAAGGFAIWWYLNQPGAGGAPSLWQQWFGGVAVPATGVVTSPASTTASAAATPSHTQPVLVLPASYVQAVTALQTAAGSNAQNFDQWSYWWQNSAPQSGLPAGFGIANSISPTMIDAMIAAGGGDRTAPMSATQWVTLLYQEQQAGVSGLGMIQWTGQTYPNPYSGWLN